MVSEALLCGLHICTIYGHRVQWQVHSKFNQRWAVVSTTWSSVSDLMQPRTHVINSSKAEVAAGQSVTIKVGNRPKAVNRYPSI